MKKFLSVLNASVLATLAFSTASQAQYTSADLIGNGDKYGGPKGVAPHAFTQPLIFGLGDSATFGIDGDIAIGGSYGRSQSVNTASGIAEGSLGATLTLTNELGWDFGARVEGTASASYTLDVTDPLQFDAPLSGVKAYVFADTPIIDIAVGRFDPGTIENSARDVQEGIIGRGEIGFSSSVGGRLAGSIGTKQGPWTATAAADIDNRQYLALQWMRPVRAITPAIGVEVYRDGNFDLAATPLSGGVQQGQGQLYAARFGGELEYGRLTFGASAGLEAFYDGTNMLEIQSMYDIGVSNKSGRFIYGISAQHRRSHQVAVHQTSVAADMTIAIGRGIDLGLGYKFTRFDDQAALEPEYSHEALADVRLSF